MRRGLIGLLLGLLAAGPASAATTPTFTELPSTATSASSGYSAVAVGDLDSDDRNDVVAVTSTGGTNRVYAFRGNDSGGLVAFPNSPRTLSGACSDVGQVVLGDLDGDSDLDVAVVCRSGEGFYLLRNPGSGALEAPVTVSVGSGLSGLAITDLNVGGGRDLVVGSSGGSQSLRFYRNSGNAAWASRFVADGLTLDAENTPTDVAAADFNDDGRPDLVSGNWNQNGREATASVFLSNPAGSLALMQAPVTLETSSSTVSDPVSEILATVAAGDVNGDGAPDVAVSTQTDSDPNDFVTIFRNTAAEPGEFGAAKVFDTPSPNGRYSLVLRDLNGDGMDDLITADKDSDTYTVAAANGTASTVFDPAVTTGVGGAPSYVATGDLTGDGRPDLVIGDSGGSVRVFRNGTTWPAQALDTTDPTGVTAVSATFQGTIDPKGLPSTLAFEFRVGASTPLTVAATPPTISGAEVRPVTATVQLAPSTTYIVRLRSTTVAGGVQYGDEVTFTTPGLAAPPAPPPGGAAVALALETTLSAKWSESFLVKGSSFVRIRGSLAGTAAAALTATVTIAGKKQKPVVFTIPEGPFTKELPLPKASLPGVVTVVVTGKAGIQDLDPITRTLRLDPPPEGIVRKAGASAARGSPFVTRLLGRRTVAWARFRFIALPKARSVTIQWIQPSGRRGGAVAQPRKTVIDSFIRTANGLPQGRWKVILRAGGRVVARITVPIG